VHHYKSCVHGFVIKAPGWTRKEGPHVQTEKQQPREQKQARLAERAALRDAA
jgi:hypothetical protein